MQLGGGGQGVCRGSKRQRRQGRQLPRVLAGIEASNLSVLSSFSVLGYSSSSPEMVPAAVTHSLAAFVAWLPAAPW